MDSQASLAPASFWTLREWPRRLSRESAFLVQVLSCFAAALVRGLTTAATLWTVAAIGLAVGGGLYVAAVAATIIILVILAGIKPLEKWYQSRSQTLNVLLRVDSGKMSIETLNNALGFPSRRISRHISSPSSNPSFDEVNFTIKRLSADEMADILRKLAALPNVREVAKI